MKYRILMDIDNTICKTNELLKLLLADFDDTVYPFNLPENFFEDNPSIFLEAEAFEGAAERLHQFLAEGHIIYYVTSRKYWFKNITVYWLKEKGFPNAPIFFTEDKRDIAQRMHANLCFDDSPLELRRLIDLMPVMVPAAEYNRSFKNRFDEWKSVQLPILNPTTF